MKKFTILLFACFCCFQQLKSQPQDSSWLDSIEFSVFTCGPGEYVYDLFGHSALRFKDKRRGLDFTYNYGTYDFDAPGFVFKFLRGQLTYKLSLARTPDFINAYERDERSVTEQKLNLNASQKERILRFLAENVKEENRSYSYDFYFDNCTTRLLDLFEDEIGNLEFQKINEESFTFRELLHQHNGKHPWTKFGMDIILGTMSERVATKKEQMFLPFYFFEYLESVQSDSKSLISETNELISFENTDSTEFQFTPMWVFGILLALECIGFFLFYISGDRGFLKPFDHLWFLLLSISSLVFLIMWFLTDHYVCSNNWNVLWAGPWVFLYFFWNEKFRKAGLYITVLCSIAVVLGRGVIPQYLPPETIIIALISILKSLRILGIVHWFDNKKKIAFTSIVLLLFLSQGNSQDKIGGITLVAPPSEYQNDPMPDLAQVHANWVALVPYGFSRKNEAMVHHGSNRQWWGERKDGIKKSLEYAKANELRVMLKPQVWIPGGWVGDVDFASEEMWQEWEDSYRKYIMSFVDLAVEYNVELFCIGTEYRISAIKREKFWRRLIEDIRGKFSGKLTYSSNWDSYENVPFWDVLDFIGISAYFPLSELKTAPIKLLTYKWKKPLKKLRQFSKRKGRRIIFTEYGYLSVDGATGKTWELEKVVHNLQINEQSQANGFDALYHSFWHQDFWAGGFIWKWFPEMKGHEGYPEKDYTPQGKKATGIIAKWYGRNKSNK